MAAKSKPCKRGHTGPRRKDNQDCVECARLRAKQQREREPEKIRNYLASYRVENQERLKEYDRERNKTPKRRAHFSEKRVKRLRAKPKWVDNEELIGVYQNRPNGFVVDHIVPLQGKVVCGLHVPWNLQYLTPQQNAQKYNKF